MKRLLKIIGALLALIILAVVSIPLLVPADTLKGLVTEELSKATGRTITIAGDASLKIFPDIAVSLSDVTLGNPAGDFKSERMFFARKLDTGVRLMPLLNKEIIITGVTLDGAEITLEETASGAKNWEFASKAGSDTKQEKAAEEGTASKFAIGDIAVKDSSVSFSPAGGKPIALSKIDLALKGADGNDPLSLKGSAVYQAEKVDIALDVKDSRGFLGGKDSPLSANISLPGGTVKFSGTGAKKADIAARGDLNVDVSALPKLLQWATGKPAAPSLPKSVSLSGPVEVNGKRISFSSFNAKADALAVSGKLAADLNGAVPALDGTLKFGVIDLAQFTGKPSQASGGASSSPAPSAGPAGWSNDPIDLSGLKAVDARLGIAIDGIRSGALELGNGAFDVNLKSGALKLGIANLALYGGHAKGNVSLAQGGIATTLDVSGVKIEPLMVALNGNSRLSGTAAMNLDLRGSGNSQKAIVGTLDGTAKLVFRDGAVKGINLGQFLRNIRSGQFFANDTEATDFAEMGGSWNFANGIGTNSDLSMKAPILRVTGNGSINLPNRSLNYRILPTLVATATGQDGRDKAGISVPLNITGPWSKPQITPDLAGMVQEGLRDPEALKSNLKNLKEGFKDFNSPKDIGKALLGGGAAGKGAEAPAEGAAPKADPKQQAIEGLIRAFGK